MKELSALTIGAGSRGIFLAWAGVRRPNEIARAGGHCGRKGRGGRRSGDGSDDGVVVLLAGSTNRARKHVL